MRRSLFTVLLALAAGAGIVAAAYFSAKHLCIRNLARTGDGLEWLSGEFNLDSAEMNRIRTLHEGYQPACREMCERIAAKQRELQEALAVSTHLTADVEIKLTEVGALRAQCQARMLRYFYHVSQAMPPGQGRRYLAEMQRLTLGFHEQFEQTMSGTGASPHEHR